MSDIYTYIAFVKKANMEYLLSNRTAAEKTDAAAHCASSLSFAMSCIHIMTAIKGNKKVLFFSHLICLKPQKVGIERNSSHPLPSFISHASTSQTILRTFVSTN
jgi:uncharacterized membrane protein YvbJ